MAMEADLYQGAALSITRWRGVIVSWILESV